MMKPKALLLVAALLAWPLEPAMAGKISAIVENITGAAKGVQQMDLLEEGQTIELPAGAEVTLGYLRSCVRETITGGRVTIGVEKSAVENGKRQSEEVDCDGGQIVRTSQRTDDVAGAVFRKGNFEKAPLPKPDWVLFGLSPVIRLSVAAKMLRIERLDAIEDPIEVPVNGTWVDLEAHGIKFAPSGLYAISSGARPYIIKVSPLAEPDAPMLSRLIVM